MKKGIDINKFLILLFVMLFFVPFISAVQPVTNVNTQVGYTIYYPQFTVVPQNAQFTLNIYASNNSNSLIIPNTEISCYLRLFNSSGLSTFDSGIMTKTLGNRHTLYITSGNFSSLGQHAFFIWCNSSIYGGEVSGTFQVNPTGEEISTGTSLIYFLVTIFAFGIFFLITWIFLNINGENPKDETGYLGINYRKYIKTALFPLVYVSFLWFFNFIIGLSNNYLGLTLYSNTLGFIFMILTKLVYPIIAVTLIIEIVLMIKDSNISKEYQSLWSQY